MSRKSRGSPGDKKASRWAQILTVVPLLAFLLAGAKFALDYWQHPAPVRLGFVSIEADALSDLAEGDDSALRQFSFGATGYQVLLRPSRLMARVLETSKRSFVQANGRLVRRATFVALANDTDEQLTDVRIRFARGTDSVGSLQPKQVLVLCVDVVPAQSAAGESLEQLQGGTVNYSRGRFGFKAPPVPDYGAMNIVQGTPNVRVSQPRILEGLPGQ